jgi:hypothetical protein
MTAGNRAFLRKIDETIAGAASQFQEAAMAYIRQAAVRSDGDVLLAQRAIARIDELRLRVNDLETKLAEVKLHRARRVRLRRRRK